MPVPICDNCESSNACWECAICTDNHRFCDDCRELHGRLKAFRSHTKFHPIQEEAPVIMCSNCDQSDAKFMCRQCTVESDRYFCLGCSLFHGKVKLYKNHSMKALADESSSSTSTATTSSSSSHPPSKASTHYGSLMLSWNLQQFERQARGHVQFLLDTFHDVLDGEKRVSSLFTAGLTAGAIAAFVASKYLFGSSSLLVNMGVLGGVYLYIQQRRDQLLREKAAALSEKPMPTPSSLQRMSSSSSRKIGVGSNTSRGTTGSIGSIRPFQHSSSQLEMEEEFPDEFPYELHGKQATLRPRRRPYQPKQTAGNNSNKGLRSSTDRFDESDDFHVRPQRRSTQSSSPTSASKSKLLKASVDESEFR